MLDMAPGLIRFCIHARRSHARIIDGHFLRQDLPSADMGNFARQLKDLISQTLNAGTRHSSGSDRAFSTGLSPRTFRSGPK